MCATFRKTIKFNGNTRTNNFPDSSQETHVDYDFVRSNKLSKIEIIMTHYVITMDLTVG